MHSSSSPRTMSTSSTGPCSTICPGPQRLGCCNSGCISPASRSDAGRALSHGKCSAHDQERSPSSVCVNAWGPSLCQPLQPWQAHALIHPTVQPTCEPVQRLRQHQCCRLRTPLFCHHHIAVAFPCLGNATSHVAAAAATVIALAIIAVATVATNTKAPHSDGRSLQHTAHDALLQPACANTRTLALVQTAQPLHHDMQAVHRTHAHHQRHYQGPHASLRTCQHCSVQQQRKSWCGTTY